MWYNSKNMEIGGFYGVEAKNDLEVLLGAANGAAELAPGLMVWVCFPDTRHTGGKL